MLPWPVLFFVTRRNAARHSIGVATLLFEALIMAMVSAMPVKAVARMVGLNERCFFVGVGGPRRHRLCQTEVRC